MLPNLAGDHRPDHGRIRAARRTPLLPYSLVITSRHINLTMPDISIGWFFCRVCHLEYLKPWVAG
jgi:hypothetical protein